MAFSKLDTRGASFSAPLFNQFTSGRTFSAKMERDSQLETPLLCAKSAQRGLQSDPEILILRQCSHCSRRRWFWTGQILLFLTSLILWAQISLGVWREKDNGRCVDKMSSYSPALEAIDDVYVSKRFSGTVLSNATKFKGPATPERIDAWNELVPKNLTFRIDHEQLLRIGAPESSAKFPSELGGGYIATLEVYHQLHCLQALWKNTWPPLYNTEAADETSQHRQHIDHCADLLRQKLMCDADTTLVTFNWVSKFTHYTPNFNVLHKCRREEDVKEWLLSHHVDRKGMNLTRPVDAVILDSLP